MSDRMEEGSNPACHVSSIGRDSQSTYQLHAIMTQAGAPLLCHMESILAWWTHAMSFQPHSTEQTSRYCDLDCSIMAHESYTRLRSLLSFSSSECRLVDILDQAYIPLMLWTLISAEQVWNPTRLQGLSQVARLSSIMLLLSRRPLGRR